MISVIIPSRGRPDLLRECIRSLTMIAADIEIVVGLDQDDPELAEYQRALRLGYVRTVIEGRHPTSASLSNRLALHHAKGDWLLMFTDDARVREEDWAFLLEKRVQKLPKQLGVVYLNDPMLPGFPTFPVVSRKTVEMVGFFNAPWFPFLYGDDWWNEIGDLSTFKIEASDVSVSYTKCEGMSDHIHDFAFWQSFFDYLRPLRVSVAAKMLREVHGETMVASALLGTMAKREAACAKAHSYRLTAEWCESRQSKHPPTPRYLAAKAKAEQIMYGKERAAA